MRRIIPFLLIAVTLFANFSWAADTHAEAYFGHGAEWSHDSSDHPDEHVGSESCDHCCHGLAHLTGMLQQSNAWSDLTVCSYSVLSTQSYRTRSQSPPTPPPNA